MSSDQEPERRTPQRDAGSSPAPGQSTAGRQSGFTPPPNSSSSAGAKDASSFSPPRAASGSPAPRRSSFTPPANARATNPAPTQQTQPASPAPATPADEPSSRPQAYSAVQSPRPRPLTGTAHTGLTDADAPTGDTALSDDAFKQEDQDVATSARTSTNRLAIIGLVLSFLGVTSIFGVICAHIARRQIRNSKGKEQGDSLAIAALWIGYFYIAALVLCLVVIFWLAGISS